MERRYVVVNVETGERQTFTEPNAHRKAQAEVNEIRAAGQRVEVEEERSAGGGWQRHQLHKVS